MKGGAKIEDPLPAPILVSAQVKSHGTPWPDPFGPVGQRAACLATLSQLSCSQDPWQEKTGDGTKARLRDAGTNCPRAQPHRECGQRGSGRKRRRQAQVCAQSRDASGLLHRGLAFPCSIEAKLRESHRTSHSGPPSSLASASSCPAPADPVIALPGASFGLALPLPRRRMEPQAAGPGREA